MKKIALIGSTGSIGVQTLNVVRRYPDEFKIVSLAGGDNSTLLESQIEEFSPLVATCKKEIKNKKNGVEYFFGDKAFLNAVVLDADIVVVSLVGFSGILAVIEALNKNKDVALANKESLVIGGELITKLAKQKNLKILPVDSEHSAIWQALDFDFNKEFKRLILTASGGAFRDTDISQLKNVTYSQALNHPNWKMGNKITVDCATLVNKAFEVIEAKWLYNTDFSKIDVIIHKESIIHSMVEFNDSSTIAQLSYPNMELPIQLVLTYPNRLNSNIDSLDFSKIATLSFNSLDKNRYPCFDLVLNAAKMGGLYTSVINGANDRAVSLFLQGKIGYLDIYKALDSALNAFSFNGELSLENIIYANDFAYNFVNNLFGVQ